MLFFSSSSYRRRPELRLRGLDSARGNVMVVHWPIAPGLFTSRVARRSKEDLKENREDKSFFTKKRINKKRMLRSGRKRSIVQKSGAGTQSNAEKSRRKKDQITSATTRDITKLPLTVTIRVSNPKRKGSGGPKFNQPQTTYYKKKKKENSARCRVKNCLPWVSAKRSQKIQQGVSLLMKGWSKIRLEGEGKLGHGMLASCDRRRRRMPRA